MSDILQYSVIIIGLWLVGDCLTQSGDSGTAGEHGLGSIDDNYEVSEQGIREENGDRNISNGIQDQTQDSEEDNMEHNQSQRIKFVEKEDARVPKNENDEKGRKYSKEDLNELQRQVIEAHSKNQHRPEIKYKIVKQFGGNQSNVGFDEEGEVDSKTLNRFESHTDKKHSSQQVHNENTENANIEGQDYIDEGDKEMEGEEGNEAGRDYSRKTKETKHSNSQISKNDEDEAVPEETIRNEKLDAIMQQKGKTIEKHLLESHLEKQSQEANNSIQQAMLHSESYLHVKVLSHLEEYEEQEVAPLHLACTATTMFDTFPVKTDMNFSKHFGLESEAFNILQSYLLGHNVEGRKISLNFPVFLTVTPQMNNTVERAICVWLSNFSSLIPPEMDRHLGFLEIPQPINPSIEIYASGKKIKYARTFNGFANDWIYRKEVKKLLDSIIENGFGEAVDFRSYCIDIEGGNKHTVSFVKKM